MLLHPTYNFLRNTSALSKECKYLWVKLRINRKQFSHKLFWNEDCHVGGLTSWQYQLVCLICVLNILLFLSQWLRCSILLFLGSGCRGQPNSSTVWWQHAPRGKWQDELLISNRVLWHSCMYIQHKLIQVGISCRSNKTSTCIKFCYLGLLKDSG